MQTVIPDKRWHVAGPGYYAECVKLPPSDPDEGYAEFEPERWEVRGSFVADLPVAHFYGNRTIDISQYIPVLRGQVIMQGAQRTQAVNARAVTTFDFIGHGEIQRVSPP